MADDVNPSLRTELNGALNIVNPQIRGMRDIVNDNISPELHDQLAREIINRERRRDLILIVLDHLDQTVAVLGNLDHDGYPDLPNVEIPSTLLTELAGEETDVEAAVGIFTEVKASSLSIQFGEPVAKANV